MAGRVLYLDLDTVITGSLDDLAGYSGPFAALSVEDMANERRPDGLNSSVMCWDAGKEAPAVQAIHDLLKDNYEVVSLKAAATRGYKLCFFFYFSKELSARRRDGAQQTALEAEGHPECAFVSN